MFKCQCAEKYLFKDRNNHRRSSNTTITKNITIINNIYYAPTKEKESKLKVVIRKL